MCPSRKVRLVWVVVAHSGHTVVDKLRRCGRLGMVLLEGVLLRHRGSLVHLVLLLMLSGMG